VNFSCSSYTSKEKALAVRTTADLDLQTLFSAIRETYDNADNGDLLSAVWANYYAQGEKAERTRNTALWVVGSGSVKP